VVGLAAAAAIAALWGRFGHRVNLPRFLQVTAVFLLLFVVQLAIYAFHELTEAGVLPLDNSYWHVATEPYGPEGHYGHWLSYGLVALPLAWLLLTTIRGRRTA
jgi:high-affinity iron transporter